MFAYETNNMYICINEKATGLHSPVAKKKKKMREHDTVKQ